MKYSTYLIHYNHNHDKLGRFARSVGGSSDAVIKKGDKFRRVTGSMNENESDSITYASSSKIDKKIYTSETRNIFGSYQGPNYSHRLKAKRDIKVAGKQAQAEAFAKVLEKANMKQLIEHTKHVDIDVNPKLRKYAKDPDVTRLYKNAKKDKESFDLAFDAFIQNLSTRSPLSNQFIDNLRSKGYGALNDEYDSRGNVPGKVNFYDREKRYIKSTTINADSAVVFLNRHEELKTVRVSKITNRDIARAERWLRKKGYVVDRVSDT